MAQTMELSLDVQSSIQVSNKRASSVVTLILCQGAIAINPKWSRNTLQAQKPRSKTGKKVIDKNFLPFPSWRDRYWQD